MSKKKESSVKRDEVIEGAVKEQASRKTGHLHPLMQVKMNLLEVSHRDIEKIEKERFIIMNKYDDMDAINRFKDFVFKMLTGLDTQELEELCE